jgi:CBS domain-containing protein
MPPAPRRARLESTLSDAMTPSVVTVPAEACVADVSRILERERISCVPAVGSDSKPIGAVSRTDLLRAGRRNAAGHGAVVIPSPRLSAGDLVTRPLITAPRDCTVSAAAARMVKERIHRIFVVESGALVGVFSTLDLLGVVHRARLTRPIEEVMSHPVFTIPVDATVAHATDRIARAHVTGLAVIDEEGWPVGTFTQFEALAAQDLSGETPLEDVMCHALACVHVGTPLHRAAAIAKATRSRRVLVTRHREVIGVVTGLDFARAISG